MRDSKLKILRLMEKQAMAFRVPSVTEVSYRKDPYQILISCILSLRTKDKTTVEASQRLFNLANTPQNMVKLSPVVVRKLIYPVGFYRNKTKVILGVSQGILRDFSGNVPDTLEDLLSFKGVGRKTANLVLGLGYDIPAICVDTHVHRISNRLGWVRTKTPEETEYALQKILPKEYWVSINTILVTFGQNVCLPIAPYCSRCLVLRGCKKIGVKNSR